jgi:hypothetical protein
VTVNDATTTVRLISSGTCTNSTDISVIYPSPTPTPTVTPSPSPVANIIYWNYGNVGTTTGANFTITKNGSTVVNTNSNGASGNFTYSPGDSIVVNSDPNVKVTSYTTVCVYNSAYTLLDSNSQTNATATVSFSTSAGGYNISGGQSSISPIICAEA